MDNRLEEELQDYIDRDEPPRKKRKTDAWRRFWGTINNPTAETTKILKSYLQSDAYKKHNISAIVLQTERGEQGTLHYQIYCELTKDKKLSSTQIHRIPGFARMALKKPPRSTRKAVEYCQKTKTRVEGLRGSNGTFRGYSGQQENQEIFDKIYKGTISARDISRTNPMLFLKSHTGLQKMIGMHQAHRDFIPKIIFYIGPTGCGKSIKAYAENKGAYPFTWPKSSTMWFDHYQGGNSQGTGHDTIIFDEFTSNRIKCTTLMDILSGKPYPVQFKGGFTTLNSHTLVFTSNEEPMDFYPGITQKAFDMLQRRIIQFSEIWDFEQPAGNHWQPDYTGPRRPLQAMLSEIVCTKRTGTPRERTVGPDKQDYGNQNYRRYPNMTGHKRNRMSHPTQITE